MARIILDGFETIEQARKWSAWYSNSGEQDFSMAQDDVDDAILSGANWNGEVVKGEDLIIEIQIFKGKEEDEDNTV